MAPENQWSVLEHYAYYAQRIIEEHLAEKLQQHGPIIPPTPPTSSSEATKNLLPKNKNPVGIIGAGVGGLYTALMLQSLGIPYQILEASSRVGGRLYTYPFPKGQSYDYFVSLDCGSLAKIQG
ncbi:hypothetical protein FRC03_004674 [Tulasnella sp. 419]|nr:hypothetical protein FRC02_000791 [Tulasnella sp. 418]KAG8941290.1 hypothetical protein FRC03_004674 [Tulasnella sp. 419]